MTATVIPFRRREQDASTADQNRDFATKPIGTIMADWDKLITMISKTMQEPRR